MPRKSLAVTIIFGSIFLHFVSPGFGSPFIGKTFNDALKSRDSDPIEEVITKFEIAAGQAENRRETAAVLLLLAEFLMEKQEWARAAEVYEQIMVEGAASNVPEACYGAAHAYLLLNQPEKAKVLCNEFKANHPKKAMEKLASQKLSLPGSPQAQLADFLAESPNQVSKRPFGANGVTSFPTARLVAVEELSASAAKEEQVAGPIKENLLPGDIHGREDVSPAEPAISARLEAIPDLATSTEFKEKIDNQAKPQKSEMKENQLSVGVRGWQSDLSGQIDAKGMSLDASHDVDFVAQTQVALNGSWNVSKKDQLQFGYMHFDHASLLKRKVTFDNLDYGVGSPLKIKSSYFDVALSHLLKESENGSWKFLCGAKFSRAFMRIEQQIASGLRVGELTQSLSVPYLGIEGNGKISANIFLNAALKYIALSGTRAHLTDFDIALLFGRDYLKESSELELYGALGYRYFSLRGETDCDEVKIRYAGPTFGLESRF